MTTRSTNPATETPGNRLSACLSEQQADTIVGKVEDLIEEGYWGNLAAAVTVPEMKQELPDRRTREGFLGYTYMAGKTRLTVCERTYDAEDKLQESRVTPWEASSPELKRQALDELPRLLEAMEDHSLHQGDRAPSSQKAFEELMATIQRVG